MFDAPEKLALGLVTGVIFGFLLQKGRAAKYHVIVGQFLLKDWTVVKIMGTAVVVGAIGVYAMLELGLTSLHVKPLLLGGVVIGAVCFGIGLSILGYCPGTTVAACGEGRRDAMVGVLGMFCGAGLFVALYPLLQPIINSLGNFGEITLPETLGVSPWLIIGALTIAAVVAVVLSNSGGWRRWSLPHQNVGKPSRSSS